MWADAVFEGGGVRAIALLGAVAVAEHRGYRWKRLAGTSAGAIVAALLAAGYTSAQLRKAISELDYSDFVSPSGWSSVPYFGPAIRLWLKKGLFAGKEIERWMEKMLQAKGMHTFADLRDHELQIVASDITRGRLLVLPKDLESYGMSPGDLSIARAVRMSCSIPFFFDPVVLHSRSEPRRNYVVDGGVLSNFPLWLFDQEHPRWPTFGFRLVGQGDVKPYEIKGPISLLRALFHTMMDAHDTRHVEEQDSVRTIFVPSLGVKATDFHIRPEQESALYEAGVKAAEKFFQQWDFEQYLRNYRQKTTYTVRIGRRY